MAMPLARTWAWTSARARTCARAGGAVPARGLTAASAAVAAEHLEFYDQTVAQLADQPATPYSLRQLFDFGRNMNDKRLITSARYLQRELPIRLAHRIRDFRHMPYIFVANPHVRNVYNLHVRAFDRLCAVPPIETAAQEQAFTTLLSSIVDDFQDFVTVLGQGCQEAKRHLPNERIHAFLDQMMRSRIGLRMLAEQHIALHRQDPGMIGIIQSNLSPAATTQRVAQMVKRICEQTYGVAPAVTVRGHVDATFPYIPVHLEYILMEVLKNAYRAVVEAHAPKVPGLKGPAAVDRIRAGSVPLPDVEVTVCHGPQDTDIRVSDQGGGIPKEIERHVWDYLYSTADMGSDAPGGLAAISTGGDVDRFGGPMAGLGFGLPASRVYAEYFGGSLNLYSMHGYGTDVYVRLNNLGNQSEVLLTKTI